MANGYGAGGGAAQYPMNGYPGVNFYGAGVPGRVGVASQASGGRGAAGAVNRVLPAQVRSHQYVALAIVVLGAYGLWHFTSRLR